MSQILPLGPQQRKAPKIPYLLKAGMLTSFVSFGDCIGEHNSYDFTSSSPFIPKRYTFPPVLSTLWLFPTSSTAVFPDPWGRVWYRCPICGWALHIFFLWVLTVSFWVNHHLCTNKLLWWGQRWALIYSYKDTNLDDSLILCSVFKYLYKHAFKETFLKCYTLSFSSI